MKTRPTLPADSPEPVSNRDRLKRYEWLAGVVRKSKGLSDADALDFAAAAAMQDLDLDIRDRKAQLGELGAYTVEYLTGLRDPRAWGPDAFLGFDPRIVRTRRSFPLYVGRGKFVLLVGKRGSGKGQLVRAVADEQGKRPHTVAMGAVPESMAASELFGHECRGGRLCKRGRGKGLGSALRPSGFHQRRQTGQVGLRRVLSHPTREPDMKTLPLPLTALRRLAAAACAVFLAFVSVLRVRTFADRTGALAVLGIVVLSTGCDNDPAVDPDTPAIERALVGCSREAEARGWQSYSVQVLFNNDDELIKWDCAES